MLDSVERAAYLYDRGRVILVSTFLRFSGLTHYEVMRAIEDPTSSVGLSHLATALLDPEGRQIIRQQLPYHTEGKPLLYGYRNEQLETVVVPFFAHKLRLIVAQATIDIDAGKSYLQSSDRAENHLLHYVAHSQPVIMTCDEAEQLSSVVGVFYPGYSYSPEVIMTYLQECINAETRIFSSAEGLTATADGQSVRLSFTPLNEPRD